MKKWIIILSLFFATNIFAFVNGDEDKVGPRQEMQIIDVMTPAGVEQMRSAVWYAEGWIDYQMNCIEIEINELIGKADVVITNMYGQAVAAAVIDPAVTTYVMLPLPAAGDYRLTITGTDYQGECNFTIE